MTRLIRMFLVVGLLALGVAGVVAAQGARGAAATCPFCAPGTGLAGPLPDLTVSSITAQALGQVTIHVWVQNTGPVAATNFWISVQVTPGGPTTDIFEDHLGANGTAVYPVVIRDPRGNAHSVTATVDSGADVTESVESNNALTRMFDW